ncbi:MAG: hypothetical protein IJ588_08900 [Prevotella sp.]|nr:hypothetical protein [Prevotella sp.]
MKKLLLTLIVALAATSGLKAQTWQWGTASWNIEDGTVYDGIADFNEKGGLVLTYTNPAEFYLTFLNIIAVSYDLYVDDATEATKQVTTGQGGTAVPFKYDFVEGHKYKIVTTGAVLVQANLATYSTDTLSENTTDSYSISFTIKGPELVKTIEVEGYQSLSITDQNEQLTYSLLDTEGIKQALGVSDISEAAAYGLNLNGSYNVHHADYYDGWRDADGEYTSYNGGWDQYNGRNAYAPVYSIKLTEGVDSILYYFYDYWRVYDPEEGGETGGSGVTTTSRLQAPDTHYNSVIWEYDNGDGTTTQYTRNYRVDEGQDYKASFAIVANKKYVIINATLHFLSQEDYAALQAGRKYEGFVGIGTAIGAQPGVPVAGIATQEQTVTIEDAEEAGQVNITFSGFTVAVPPITTENLTITAKAEKAADGSITYSSEPQQIGLSLGAMTAYYQATIKGTQASESEAPVLVLTLAQAATVTVVFNTTAELASAALSAEYAAITSVEAVKIAAEAAEVYNLNGVRQTTIQKGFNLVKQADGSVRKILVK